MKFSAITDNFPQAQAEALVIVVFKDEKADSEDLKELNKITGGLLDSLLRSEEFSSEELSTHNIYLPENSGVKAKRLLIISGGDKEEFKPANIALATGTAARFLRKAKVKSFAFNPRFEADALEISQFAAQGVVTSQFELDKYQTRNKDKKPAEIANFLLYVKAGKASELREGLRRGQIIGESMNIARDLANEPPNILTPTEMAQRASKIAKEVGLKCEILDEAKMEKLGMGSLLSVSRGSAQPAKLIVLKYTPAKSSGKKETIALVGKGITFDTGGISLKPSEGMEAMKYDMSGGATVIATMRAIALIKPKVPVIGVVAAVENMPGGKASRPSDVVKAFNGKTVEILNTDAEGRLILADAVAYAEKQGAGTIIDMATLTGAVIVALGDINTGILGNDQTLIDEIIQCGKECGEGYWQLPVGKQYSKMIRSDIADVKNIGPRGKAGTIIGAVFIQEFIDKAKWAHLDIAGTAWCDTVRPFQAKGPTGVAVRTLLRYIEKNQ
jgi:leucyl aminopeptidase